MFSATPAYAASLSNLDFRVKNMTTGVPATAQVSANAEPGHELAFTMQARNASGATIPQGRVTLPKNANWTYVVRSTRWAWSSGTNTMNNGVGEVLFSPYYIDSDSSGTVTAGDIRVNKYGLNATSSGPLYAEGSTVVGGDDDTNYGTTAPLTSVSDLKVTGGSTTWAVGNGQYVYVKGASNSGSTVEIGDMRVLARGSYLAGSIIVAGDTDLGDSIQTATNLKRLGATTWPFDEGGFPIGSWGNAKTFLVKDARVTVNSDSTSSITDTVTFSGSGVSGESPSTINVTVDTTPSVTSVSLSPTSIANDGIATTTLTAIVNDKNGISDITGVTANLTALGGSSAVALTNAGSGTWTLSGITTTIAAGTKSIAVTATDTTNQTATNSGSLVVQSTAAPTITINTATPTTIGGSGDVTINWQASKALYKYELRFGSCSGTLATGTNVTLGDGSAEILTLNTPVSSVINNASFSAGANNVYICGTDVDTNVGQNFAAITKDLTAPTVTVSSAMPTYVTTGQSVSVAWSANETGTYAVKIGSCSGATASGTNASGNYTSGSLTSTVPVNDLAEGSNTIYVCLTDTAGNASSATGTATKDTTAPTAVTGITLVDNDTTHDGVDGYDLTVNWSPATTDSSFSNYKIYVLPAATTLDTLIHTPLATVTGQTTTTWTGTNVIVNDSAGNALAAGSYTAYIIARDIANQSSTAAASPAATLTLDDISAPTFTSAVTVDTNTVRLVFSEPISTVDTTKISATGLTIDTSYNTNGYTNGWKVSSPATRVLLRVTTLSTGYTASNLTLTACAVRDVTGSSNLNEAGNCTDSVPSTNANAAASGLAISDGVGPTITLTNPANSASDNATVAINYALSEAATTASVRLKFTASGGSVDPNSPHTIVLQSTTNGISSMTGGTGEESGSHTAILAGGGFTSMEHGATDTFVNGAIYTVTLDASDTLGNVGTTATNTSWTYDTTAPTAPVTTQAFSSPTANPAPTFNWSTVSDATSYTIQISLQSTSYSPVFTTQTITAPTTSYTLSPAFLVNGSADDTYVWRVYATDSAGNISSASNQQTFTLNTQTDTPSLLLKDTTSDSQTHTNSTTVHATLDGYASDVLYYILSETQTTQPAVSTPGWTAVPMGGAPQTVTYTFTNATEALKTVYVWVKDSLDNISNTVSTATITLDTTPPGQPTLTANDANSGAQPGKTNAATVAITVGNDAGVAKWCVASGASSWTPTTPTESACTTGVIGGASASGWLTTRPTTHALAATGIRDLYTWTMDTAGNISTASAPAIIDYATALPPDPTLTLASQITGSTSYTSTTTVDATVTNDGTAWKWIVSTSQASQPAENSASWTSEPTTATLTSGDGVKTVYVWVKDVYGNINQNQVAAAITLDTTAPTFSVRKTQDLDADGQIDAIQITMTESVADSRIALALANGVFTLSGSYGIANGYSGTLGSVTFSNGFSTGNTSNDAIYYLAVTESGAIDTSVTPTLTYTQPGTVTNRITDLAGNYAATSAATTTDGVAPVRIATNPVRIYDTNGNGKADQVKVIFSEGLAATTATTPWALTAVPSGGILSSVTRGTTNVSNDTIIITLTEGSATADTTVGSAAATLDNASGAIADSNSNAAASFSGAAAADYMGPAIVSANYISTGTLTTDSLIISFSENISDASLALADFTLASGGSLANASVGTGATANDSSITLTDLSAGAPTIGTSTIRFSSVGGVADASAQANTNLGTATTIIRGGLIINEIGWAGMNGTANDQYVEIRNVSATNAIDFSSDNHILCRGTTPIKALTSGTLAANSYFLIANLSQAASQLNVAPDLVGFSNALLSSGTLSLTLRTGTSCSAGTTLDSAWNGTAPSIGGSDIAIERSATIGDGTAAGSWYAAVATNATIAGEFDTTTPKGTPKSANIADALAPTFSVSSPDTRTPIHQSLLPASPATIAVSYADNIGGVGVNTAAVTIAVDLNGDGDYADTVGGYAEGTSGICSGSALTTKSATHVVCTLPTALIAGRHSVRATVIDLAGNSAQTSWDFWVDNFTFVIGNRDQANLGTLTPGTGGVSTMNNARHTTLTITTYGAGFSLSASPSGQLTSGAETITWHANNTSTASTGAAYRLKTGATGTFGNYFNFNAQPQLVSVATLSGNALAAANTLTTYTYYVEYFVDATATQAAGGYTNAIDYHVAISY